MNRAALLSLVLLVSCSFKNSPNSKESARSLVIATSEPLVNQAAAEVFERGGSLADAAVAASFAISVVRPQSTGIGGGGFLIFKPRGKPGEVLDFREAAPRKASATMYVRGGRADSLLSLNGPLAVATPGLVAGLHLFHQKYGKLPWAQLLEPAIRLAESGVKVSGHLERAIQTRWDVIQADPEMLKIFTRNLVPLKEGDLLIQTDLAKTLRRIAALGAREFYEGETAQMIASMMRARGGLIDEEDLKNYRVLERQPLEAEWRGYRVMTMPPPSSGGLHLLQILKMTEQLPMTGSSISTPASLLFWPKSVWEIEAFKRAYADRAVHLGDPDFHTVPVSQLLDDGYLKARAQEILSGKILAGSSISPWREEAARSKQTSHLSLMDHEGNAISTTQTVNYLFGAAVIAPGSGVVLNDEMDDFSIQPGVANVFGLVGGAANEIRPLKRPLSSMTPTIVVDESGLPRLVIGAPGGSRIITGVYRVMTGLLREGLSPEEAIAACRVHHQWSPDRVTIESRCGDLGESLKTFYDVETKDSVFGEVQMVGLSSSHDSFAVADPRGHGKGEIFHFPK